MILSRSLLKLYNPHIITHNSPINTFPYLSHTISDLDSQIRETIPPEAL
jgi:hypothetical protein